MTPEQIAQLLALNGQGAPQQPAPPPGFLAGPPLPTATENYGTPDAQPNPAVTAADDASHARAAQLPGAPFPVASGAPYARQAPAATPTPGTPTPGMPAPQGSPIQPATVPDMARQQNDVIRQLMGARPRGMSNIGQWYQTAFDKYQDAEQHDYDVRANALLGHLGEMGRQANTQGGLNLDRVRLLGTPGTPGGLVNSANMAENPSAARGAAATMESVRSYQLSHPSASIREVHNAVASDLGMSLNTLRQHLGLTTPRNAGSAPPVPAANQDDAVRQPAAEAPTPWASIEPQLDRVSRYLRPTQASGTTPATPGGLQKDPSGNVHTVGSFINNLEANNPGMLAEHYPEIRNYITSRFGEGALQSADQLAGVTPETGITSILGGRRGSNRRRERFSGTTDEDRGLSVLSNLHQAIQGAGGHAAFLRQQRGLPPLPR